ncbi:MAG: ComEC/Rec2 family competence protein [Anaerolineae bacterium]|nr:ComEC/Rec2 family competence protein [Anaerolineae bacterium]
MILFYMALAWAAGIFFASRLALDSGAWPVLPILAGLGMAVLFRRDAKLRLIGLCALAAGLGAARYAAVQPILDESHLVAYNDGNPAVLFGVVTEPPDVRDANTRLRVEVETIRPVGESARPAHGAALVYADRVGDYHYGDRVRVYGWPQTPGAFDAFSWRDYLARSGVYTVVYRAEVAVQARGEGNPLLGALYGVRESAHSLINRLLPEPHAGLLAGVLLGERSGIAPDTDAAFRQTGAAHLLVISGANIAVLAGLLTALTARLIGRVPSAMLTLAGIVAYTALVGADPPVVRAAIMVTFSIAALRFGRQSDGLTALAASAWLLTLADPMALFDAGLILSVMATLGLILYYGPMRRLTEALAARLFAKNTARRFAALAADTVLVTLAAQLTVLPVLLLLNPEFSLAALPVNVLVAPAQAWIMTLGLLAVAAGAVILPLGQIMAWMAALPLAYTLAIIRAAAGPGLPIDASAGAVLAYYAVLFGATATLSRPPERRRELLARLHIPTAAPLAGALALLVLIGALLRSRPDGRLHVWFLDTGEGDAVLIQTPNGAHVLIDGGENPTRLLTALGDRLPFHKRALDLLVITGDKPANTAALGPLVERYAVQAALIPDESQAVAVQNALRARNTAIAPVRAGYSAQTDDGVRLDVLYAPDDGPERSSLALRLAHGDATFLFMAEMTAERAADVARAHGDAGAVVVQLPSNGAASANPPEFLARLRPQVAVVFAEAGNRAAMPAESVVRALGETPLFRTDYDGTVEIATDGRQLWISTGR